MTPNSSSPTDGTRLICFLPQRRFAEANDVYVKGIDNCPDSSDLHNNYGVFLVDAGETVTGVYQRWAELTDTSSVCGQG